MIDSIPSSWSAIRKQLAAPIFRGGYAASRISCILNGRTNNSDGCRLAQAKLSYLSSTSTNRQPSEFVVLPARDSSHLEFSFEVRSTPVW